MAGDYLLFLLILIPFLGGLLCYLTGRTFGQKGSFCSSPMVWCGVVLTGIETVSFALLFGLQWAGGGNLSWEFIWEGFCGMGLHLCLDGFRALYCLVASFMWSATMLFNGEYMKDYHSRERYMLFTLFTLGATVGVFLSADLFTAFIFFEIMSFTSYTWVAHEETGQALRAAETYLAVAVIGGLVMLMGLFILYHELGTLEIGKLAAAASAAGGLSSQEQDARYGRIMIGAICVLFGYGAKAGVFPLHIWLPKAHPVAPAPASALLSGILTKAGIFGVLVMSCQLLYGNGAWGSLILLLGVLTMFTGALLALFSVNLKRTLACSSVSQIGFILVGIGMQGLLGGTSEGAEAANLAIRGSLLHMVNHSLIKLVLFMAAGVVFMNLLELDLNRIRGFGRKKTALKLCFGMGALGIGGIPLWNGYLSKTLLHESIVEYRVLLAEGAFAGNFVMGNAGMGAVEWIFLISGGMTVAYMLKLYICLFVEKNQDRALQEKYDGMRNYMNRASCVALGGGAVLLPLLGMLPYLVTDRLADLSSSFLHAQIPGHHVAYFSFGNLKGALISIGIGAAVYLFVIRKGLMAGKGEGKRYADRWPSWLDLENLIYRPILADLLPVICGSLCRIADRFLDFLIVLLRKTLYRDSKIPHELEEGNFMTHMAGSFLDGITGYFNRPDATKEEEKEVEDRRGYQSGKYEHKLAMVFEDMSENRMIIARSLSFGLFLASLGLLLTLVYMLF